jgi:Protein of unknown function (DUF4232)
MHSRTRRILPALLLASALSLSLSACEEKVGDKAGGSAGKSSPSADPGKADQDGDGAGRSDVGPCDDKTHLETTMGRVTESGDSGSVLITITNTGSAPCVLPKVRDLSLWDKDDAKIDLNVDAFNSDSEVALRPDGIASAKLNYNADPDAAPAAAGDLEFDGIGKVSVDAPRGEMKMGGGSVQLRAFETSN